MPAHSTFRLPASRALVAALLCCAVGSLARAQQTGCITAEGFDVEIDARGLIVGPHDLALTSIDGPDVLFLGGNVEIAGIAYNAQGIHVEASASTGADWAARIPFVPVSFEATADFVRSVMATRHVELETTYQVDPIGPNLIVTVDIRNRLAVPVTDVFLSREWLTRAPGWTFPTDLPALPDPPPTLARRLWMSDDLAPGGHTAFTFSWRKPAAAVVGPVVPLQIWTDPSFPSGLDYGATNGISIGDYDNDGWWDVFCTQSHRLWRNLNGQSWSLVATLPLAGGLRYGCAFGDYDLDGLHDIATAPRSPCMNVLRNLGGGPNFMDVSGDTAIVPVPACGSGETMCWGDVDGDLRLDLFVPVYPPTGNFFYWNRGPVGPGGATAFLERSALFGLDNPPGANRPEGAQFCDYDFDGDMDLYSNNTLYQNRSTLGAPDFDALPPAVSGITLAATLEEGAVFCDFDLDGDFDLPIVYSSAPGLRIWENRGDGTFIVADSTIIDSPMTGLDLGLSAEDWDNDGDIDLTTRQVFRPNLLADGGGLHYEVGTHALPANWLTSATPAWGDWDKDGDLDCALGNWQSTGHFVLNTTYVASTPRELRRYVRVAAVRDNPSLPNGHEVEYGAIVEVRTLDVRDPFRRKKLVSSAAGYLNQNEYTLTMAVPADPFPGDVTRDLHFDVIVDFPAVDGLPLRRVDKITNPSLGNVDLAQLLDRDIRVFRSGLVILNGVPRPPLSPASADVWTTTKLVLPTIAGAPPAPTVVPDESWFGLQVDTQGAAGPFHVHELIFDGQLAPPTPDAGGSFNVAVWDVTSPGAPVMLARNAFQTSARNTRSFLPFEADLPAGRTLRIVAHATSIRGTAVTLPATLGGLQIDGGLSLHDDAPITGAAVESATLDPAWVSVAVRFGS